MCFTENYIYTGWNKLNFKNANGKEAKRYLLNENCGKAGTGKYQYSNVS